MLIVVRVDTSQFSSDIIVHAVQFGNETIKSTYNTQFACKKRLHRKIIYILEYDARVYLSFY